ncbi:MAG TPA: BTAD domain-containing putative transcriptional regulator [Anaerolineae bacterium]|nr:BTAD domain-containing putative transcriptional regulator [Anaerolineae bacterium]
MRAATELLAAGQYERLAELLHQVQLAHDRQGDTIPAHVLVLARRICLACSQSQAEADWHQQACEEAAQREDKLRHQLTTLLDLVSERDLSFVPGEWDLIPDAPPAALGPPAPDLPEPAEPLSLWQRIQGVLRWRLGPQPLEAAGSEVRIQGLGAPTLGRAEVDMLSPVKEAETPSRPSGDDAHIPAPSPVEASEVADSSHSMPEYEADRVTPVETEKQEEAGPPSLVIYSLGLFRVYNNLHLIGKWPGLKCKSIFKYMIFHRKNPIHREVLMDLFWPEAGPEAASRNLYQAVYSLRQALKAGGDAFPYILCEDSCYSLNPEIDLWVDSEAFLAGYHNGQQLEQAGHRQEAIREYELAESLYEGEFLAEDRYEDWPVIERENLKHTHLDLLDRLSQFYFEQGHFNMCIEFCQKILAEDNCREDIHRRLMRCFMNRDQVHLAMRQYHLCAETMKRELDVPPMLATIELYRQIRNTRVQIPDA